MDEKQRVCMALEKGEKEKNMPILLQVFLNFSFDSSLAQPCLGGVETQAHHLCTQVEPNPAHGQPRPLP
jgi:hypothetical protein